MKKTLLKKKRIRRMLLPALCVCLVIGMMTGTALGEERLILKIKPPTSMAEDFPKASIVVDVYKIADAEETSGNYIFTPSEQFTGLIIPDLNTQQDDSNVMSDFAANAKSIAQSIEKPVIPDFANLSIGKDEITVDVTEKGTGLYLLLAHGTNSKDAASSSEYNYSFNPVITPVPTKEDLNKDGKITTDEGPWVSDVTVDLKATRTPRTSPPSGGGNPPGPGPSPKYGDLEIIKNLTSYEDSEPATFVFEVTAYESATSDKIVYSDVVVLTFTEPGQKHTFVRDLPAGAKVTVKEYSTGHYTADTATEVTPDGVISASQVLQASFTNSYDSHSKGGHGIVNSFNYSGNTWNWEQKADNAA